MSSYSARECPWCGNRVVYVNFTQNCDGMQYYRAECNSCASTGPERGDRVQEEAIRLAIEAWNGRCEQTFTADQLRAAHKAQGDARYAAGMADCSQEECIFAGLMAVVKSLGVG